MGKVDRRDRQQIDLNPTSDQIPMICFLMSYNL